MSNERFLTWVAVLLLIAAGVAVCSTDMFMTPIERSYRARGVQ
jgi:hypothetical protein